MSRAAINFLLDNYSDILQHDDIQAALNKWRTDSNLKHVDKLGTYATRELYKDLNNAGLNYNDIIIQGRNPLFTIVGGIKDGSQYDTGKRLLDSEGNLVRNKWGSVERIYKPKVLNRYAGVNNHFKGCILGMNGGMFDDRNNVTRVFFTDQAIAEKFLEGFNKKFGGRDLNFHVHKLDRRNWMFNNDNIFFCKVNSDCGECYQLFKI